MSRSTTSSATASQASKSATMPQTCVPADRVAKLAYEKWVKAGCKHGCDKQHWYEAEAELKAEMTRTSGQAKK